MHKIKDFSEIKSLDEKNLKQQLKYKEITIKTMQLNLKSKTKLAKQSQTVQIGLHLSWNIVSLNQLVMEFIISLIKVN